MKIGLAGLGLAGALALAAVPSAATRALTADETNLAYCHVVLSDPAYGGMRLGEDDPGSAAVLLKQLSTLLKLPETEIAQSILPPIAVSVANDMAAKKRPRFSPTACAGYAHFIKTQ